jgi:hypothetical protein
MPEVRHFCPKKKRQDTTTGGDDRLNEIDYPKLLKQLGVEGLQLNLRNELLFVFDIGLSEPVK